MSTHVALIAKLESKCAATRHNSNHVK